MPFFKNLSKVILLLPLLTLAQKPQTDSKRIDDLITRSELLFESSNDIKSLELAQEASEMAMMIGDNQKLAKSYYLIARVFTKLQLQKKSILYLSKAEDLGFGKKNPIEKAEIMVLKSQNYNTLNLNVLSLKEYQNIITLLEQNSSTEALKIKLKTYGNIGGNYFEKNQLDSVFKYLNKTEIILKQVDPNTAIINYPKFYDAKGYYFLQQNKMDSALFYFNKGYNFKIEHKIPVLFDEYCAFGDYYYQKKDYKKALENYIKTVENFESTKATTRGYFDVYKTISELYGKFNESEKEKYYLDRYAKIIDSVNQINNEKIDYVTNMHFKESEIEINNHFKALPIIILTIIVLFIVVGYFYYKRYFVTKKEYIQNLEIHKNEINLNALDLHQKIILLGQKNDENFYAQFQELHPLFQAKLLAISTDLEHSELVLLAYIYLDFETKTIAEATTKSIRTIQNKKNRIRKKLELKPNQNLSLWLKKIMNS